MENDDIARLLPDLSKQVAEFLAGRSSRRELGTWSASVLKLLPTQATARDDLSELIEYALSRCIDDDWTPEVEYQQELRDLQRRLELAQSGIVKLP